MNYATATIEPDITEQWTVKVNTLSPMVKRIARGDEDLYQEGILGIRDGLLRDPQATDSYLLHGARFAMSNYRNRGKSIDNGSRHATTKKLLDGTVKTYRKDMVPVYIDKLLSNFQIEFPDSSYAPEILALDKICAERFYGLLDKVESEFVTTSIQCLDGRNYDSMTMKKLDADRLEYDKLRCSTHQKFILSFGTDEEIEQDKDIYS